MFKLQNKEADDAPAQAHEKYRRKVTGRVDSIILFVIRWEAVHEFACHDWFELLAHYHRICCLGIPLAQNGVLDRPAARAKNPKRSQTCCGPAFEVGCRPDMSPIQTLL